MRLYAVYIEFKDGTSVNETVKSSTPVNALKTTLKSRGIITSVTPYNGEYGFNVNQIKQRGYHFAQVSLLGGARESTNYYTFIV